MQIRGVIKTNMKNNETNKHKTFIVVNPIVAKGLLKLGYTIIDLKPHRNDSNKAVFVFKSEGNIANDYSELHNKMKLIR